MPYIKRTCRAGKTKNFCFYYSPRYHPPGEKREQQGSVTSEAQKKVNRRLAERTLTELMNANFSDNDLYITWHYKKECRPDGKEELRTQIRKLLRKLRNLYKKAEKVLKYIWVAEVGKRGAAHIHMVLTGYENIKALQSLWTYGHINVQPLDSSGRYRKLAEYFIKYSDVTINTDQELQGKRYNCSRNLIRPIARVRPVTYKKRYSQNIKIPTGYYLDKGSVREGINDITGYSFFCYTIVKT